MTDQLYSDVLIIGAGAAGIRAALAASEAGAQVLITAKKSVSNSGSSFSPVTRGWGIQGLVGRERMNQNLNQFYNEIMKIGLGKCNPKLVRILVEDSGGRIEDLLSYGLRFKTNGQGTPIRAKGCFSNIERAFVTENFDNVKKTFAAMPNRSNIRFLEARAIDLITAGHSCWGAWVLKNDAEIVQVKAKSTVLATGGGSAIFPTTLAGDTEIGDGYCLAFRAGAELINLEYIQFMLGFKQEGNRLFLPLSHLKEQNRLEDEAGNYLLQDRIPDPANRQKAVSDRQGHFPFSCRDSSYLIDMAVARQRQKEKIVVWKTEVAADVLKVDHFSHAFNGGIKIDESAETVLPGLFAAGEVAAGPHGADRIGGCMMTATQVFGERAGRFAARRAKTIKTIPEFSKKLEITQGSDPHLCVGDLLKMQDAAKKTIGQHLMVLRSHRGLLKCRETLETIQKDWKGSYGAGADTLLESLNLRSILTVGALVSESALNNPVSVGSHFRIDGYTEAP